MKDPLKRLKQTIAVAVICIILYSLIMLYIGQRHYDAMITADNSTKTEAIRSLVEGYGRSADEIGSSLLNELNTEVRLMTIRFAEQIAGGEFTGERFDGSSMVVRVRNGKVEVPSEAEGLLPLLTAQMITGESAQTRTVLRNKSVPEDSEGEENSGEEEVFLSCGRISGDWYLVKWLTVEEYVNYIMARQPEEKMLEPLGLDNDIEFFIAADSGLSQEEGGSLLYKTKGLSDCTVLADLGISEEDLEKDFFPMKAEDGKEYSCFPVKIEQFGQTVVCCYYVGEERTAVLGDLFTQIMFVIAMVIGLLTWCFSVQWMVRKETLREDQKERYRPEMVRKRTTKLALMETVIVTVFAVMTVFLQYMYQTGQTGGNVLTMLNTQIEDAQENGTDTDDQEAERYERLGKIVSAMLTENTALLERARLEELAGAISAEYIIVYDENGKEMACSRSYINFELPTDPKDPFTDFRRLLRGVQVISHKADTDMITSETRPFMGIRYDYPGEEEHFGALLIALPSRSTATAEETGGIVQQVREQIYRSLDPDEQMIMEVDPQTHRVLSCSNAVYTGSDADSLGLIKEKEIKDRHLGFYYIDDEWHLGITRVMENRICYYLTDIVEMSLTGLLFAILSGGLFLLIFVITSKYAFREYTQENYERYAQDMLDSSENYLQSIERRWSSMGSVVERWRSMLPEQKTKTALQIGTGIILIILTVIALGNSPLSRHSALSFVFRGNWDKGLNLFSLIAVIVTCAIGYLLYLLLSVIFGMLFTLTDSIGDTVLSLIQSFLKYLLFIGTFCMSLSYIGVDTVTLLASLGVISLAISLGAKDIVTDIIAGLSIVFERTFIVGDHVQIGDFKGQVLEIGIRSTKIISGTHEVKTIYNHQIGNVINFDRRTAVCTVRIRVPVTASIEEIRELLERELPQVRKVNPHIEKGPRFEGILDFDDDRMIIGISAEGREEYIQTIRRDLNAALQSMAERQLLQYARSHITVKLQDSEQNRQGKIRGFKKNDAGPKT